MLCLRRSYYFLTRNSASRVLRQIYTTADHNDDSKNSIKVPTSVSPHDISYSGDELNSTETISKAYSDGQVPDERKILRERMRSERLLELQREIYHKLKLEEEVERAKLRKIPTPKMLKKSLDEYIVGQDTTKKIISVSMYKHQFIQQLSKINQMVQDQVELEESETKHEPELEKSNILLLGPSGSGKTLIAKTLARLLNLPIAITDCTSLTQAGFVGEDCESCIEKLLINSNYDVELCQSGIVVLDEIDKLAKPAVLNGTKDIAGEGVQQGLLKLIEGAHVAVKVKNYLNLNGSSDTSSADKNGATEQHYLIDTSNILFICMGAFIGLDKIITLRFKGSAVIDDPKNQKSEKPASIEAATQTESDFQSSVASSLDDELMSTNYSQVKLSSGKSVSSLQLVSPIDLQQFGLIPELIGRLPILTALNPLSVNNLVQISTEPKNSIVKQYENFFNTIGVRLAITKAAIKKIARISILNGTGARGLRSVLEKILLTVNYDCPGSGVSFVLIDRDVIDDFEKKDGLINGEIGEEDQDVSAKYFSRGEIFRFLNEVEQEDPELALVIEDEYLIPKTGSNNTTITG